MVSDPGTSSSCRSQSVAVRVLLGFGVFGFVGGGVDISQTIGGEEKKVLLFTVASCSCDAGLENEQGLGDLTVKNSKNCYISLGQCCVKGTP